MGKLTALAARALSKPGRHGDGDGLYLNVAPSGSKSWVQRIVVDGRRRDIGLGPYHRGQHVLGPGYARRRHETAFDIRPQEWQPDRGGLGSLATSCAPLRGFI